MRKSLGHETGDVRVEQHEGVIERGQPASLSARELGKPRVRDLTMALRLQSSIFATDFATA